jgi:hypothetical protein
VATLILSNSGRSSFHLTDPTAVASKRVEQGLTGSFISARPWFKCIALQVPASGLRLSPIGLLAALVWGVSASCSGQARCSATKYR